MTPTDTALKIMRERNTTTCECCGVSPAEECHHCLYGKDNKTKGAKKLLDMTYNLQLVCKACHSCEALSHENRVRFWAMQCERYGHDVMVAWHAQLNYKVKIHEYR